MEQLEDSFDGTFPDNIRSPAYKATHNPKKNRIVLNVAGTPRPTQTLSTPWSSTSLKKTSGSSRRNQSTT